MHCAEVLAILRAALSGNLPRFELLNAHVKTLSSHAGLGDSAGLQSSPRAVDTEAAEGKSCMLRPCK